MAMYIIFSACSKDDAEYNIPDSDVKEESENTINKIAGVWESTNNDLYFISISSKGQVAYCFGEYTMGIGYAKLNGRKLVIENDYSGHSDKLEIDMDGDRLSITGHIPQKGTGKDEYIILLLKKVDEINIYSFMGEFWMPFSGLHVIYGSVQETLSFVGSNTAQYRYYVVRTGKMLHESLWYYIPRKHHKRGDIIYVHKSDELTPILEVYNSSFFKDQF